MNVDGSTKVNTVPKIKSSKTAGDSSGPPSSVQTEETCNNSDTSYMNDHIHAKHIHSEKSKGKTKKREKKCAPSSGHGQSKNSDDLKMQLRKQRQLQSQWKNAQQKWQSQEADDNNVINKTDSQATLVKKPDLWNKTSDGPEPNIQTSRSSSEVDVTIGVDDFNESSSVIEFNTNLNEDIEMEDYENRLAQQKQPLGEKYDELDNNPLQKTLVESSDMDCSADSLQLFPSSIQHNTSSLHLDLAQGAFTVHPSTFNSNAIDNSPRPCLFEKLPRKIHKILASRYFFSVFDLKHIGQTFPRLARYYSVPSWRSLIVVCDEKDSQVVRQANKRTVPLRVFANPQMYSRWFERTAVKSVEFQLPLTRSDSIADIFGMAGLNAQMLYPKLQFAGMVYNETDYWQIDDVKELMGEVSNCELGIVANVSAQNCISRKANVLLNIADKHLLKYLAIDMSAKPSWIGLSSRNLDFTRFRLCDFVNVETLFFQPHSGITYEKHKEIMKEIGQMSKLRTFGTCIASVPVTMSSRTVKKKEEMTEEKDKAKEEEGKEQNFYFKKDYNFRDTLVLQYPEMKSESTQLLKMLSNLNYVTKTLDYFIVSVSSIKPFGLKEYTNKCLNLNNVTHFSCKVLDTIESPILDHLRFSESLSSLKLVSCALAHPIIPESITDLTITISDRSLLFLKGYSNILKCQYPKLKRVKLCASAPFSNLQYPFNKAVAKSICQTEEGFNVFIGLIYQMSRHENLFSIVSEATQNGIDIKTFLRSIFPLLALPSVEQHQDNIVSIITNPENIFSKPGYLLFQAAALIECFVDCCIRETTLRYISVDGFAFFSLSPRFHSFFLRREHEASIQCQVRQVLLTGTDVSQARTTIEKYGYLEAGHEKTNQNNTKDLQVFLKGFPFEYMPVCEVSERGASNIVIDLEARDKHFVPVSIIKQTNSMVFNENRRLKVLKEMKNLKVVKSVSRMLKEIGYDEIEENEKMEGWLR